MGCTRRVQNPIQGKLKYSGPLLLSLAKFQCHFFTSISAPQSLPPQATVLSCTSHVRVPRQSERPVTAYP